MAAVLASPTPAKPRTTKLKAPASAKAVVAAPAPVAPAAPKPAARKTAKSAQAKAAPVKAAAAKAAAEKVAPVKAAPAKVAPAKATPSPAAKSVRVKAPKAPAVVELAPAEFAAESLPEPTFRPKGGVAQPKATQPAPEAKPAKAAKPAPKRKAAAAAADPMFPSVDEYGYDLPVPVFRPRQRAPKADPQPRSQQRSQRSQPKPAPEPVAEVNGESSEAASEAGNLDPRRKRRRRGRDRDPESTETTQTDTSEAPPELDDATADLPRTVFRDRRVEAPKPVVRPLIPVPENAPQVVVRNGVPTLVRDHRVYPALMFFGSSPDERRASTVLDELKMAAEAGVHLHSHLIEFEVDPAAVDAAVGFAAYMLAQSVKVDPESQVVFRLVFQAPRNWVDRYPNAKYRTADGSVAEPSLCDDDFWGVARNCLATFIAKMNLLDLKDHFMGVHLERGEWFFAADWGYDTSKAAQTKFRDWGRTRYGNDEVTLRASWFDGSVKFDTITIPEYQPEGSDGDKFVRSSRKQRRYVDYHLFLSDVTVARISELAYAVKEMSQGMNLVGVSYGYTFEWSHPSNGHLGLGKLLRSPEIDFIAGPPSYRTREPGGAAPFPGPIDSFALNGKLYISEEDFKTSLSKAEEPDDFNPVIKTPQALESIHWRGAGAALAHGSGVAWMDLWGNGWLRTHSVWERATWITKSLIGRMNAGLGDPEVAVFIDERALAYLVDRNAFTLLVQNVREAILRAGVSAGFYLLSDLAHREKFPESKLYIFLNAWDVRPELRAAIKSRLQRDNKVLFWLYAAGLFDAGRDSLERAREVTGIALKPQPFHSKAGTTILNRRHPLAEAFPERTITSAKQLEPSYFAIPEDAIVLGEYTQTGLPSFVVKEFKEGGIDQQWTSVFLGEPLVNPALIRALAQMAGAHVYNFHQDTVHVRPPFCTVHCASTGPRSITLPDKWSAYNLKTSQWASLDSTSLRFQAAEGETHVFLVGPRPELEHILQTNPTDLLRMETLPARDQNLREDHSTFDVPIMKLDQWMEGGDTDEVADEWFLRPPQIPEEVIETATESTEKIGRRRRRRRGGRDDRPERDGSSSGGSVPAGGGQFDDLGLNVMFRKRD